MRPKVRPVLVLLAACSAAICQDSQTAFSLDGKWTVPAGSTFPGAEWEKLPNPKAVGYSTVKLEALRAWLKAQNTTGMLAIVGGRVLFEYGDTKEVSKIASVRKSYASRDHEVWRAKAHRSVRRGISWRQFALDICNIHDPMFSGLPATLQNLPFVKQARSLSPVPKRHRITITPRSFKPRRRVVVVHMEKGAV
jgi:hypothetical protein